MHGKQIGGLVALIFGILLLSFSIYAKMRIGEAKGGINQGTSLLPGRMIGKTLDTTIKVSV